MADKNNPYKLRIEYDEQIEEIPFDPNIHKSKNDFTMVPERLAQHSGYRQLCIIREKQGNHSEVIRLAEQAKSEGWVGDWDKRIERAKKKIEK